MSQALRHSASRRTGDCCAETVEPTRASRASAAWRRSASRAHVASLQPGHDDAEYGRSTESRASNLGNVSNVPCVGMYTDGRRCRSEPRGLRVATDTPKAAHIARVPGFVATDRAERTANVEACGSWTPTPSGLSGPLGGQVDVEGVLSHERTLTETSFVPVRQARRLHSGHEGVVPLWRFQPAARRRLLPARNARQGACVLRTEDGKAHVSVRHAAHVATVSFRNWAGPSRHPGMPAHPLQQGYSPTSMPRRIDGQERHEGFHAGHDLSDDGAPLRGSDASSA